MDDELHLNTTLSSDIEEYVRNWTGWKGRCNCETDWICPVCDLKHLVRKLADEYGQVSDRNPKGTS